MPSRTRRYFEVRYVDCRRHPDGRLAFTQVSHHRQSERLTPNSGMATYWRGRIKKGGLQVVRTIKSPEKIGKSDGFFRITLEVAETSYKGDVLTAHKQLWKRPEFALIASHLEEQYAHAAVLRASVARPGDALSKETEKLERQADKITLLVAKRAIDVFVKLEKEVKEACKATPSTNDPAADKTADDMVRLHSRITKSLLADGEEILRQLKGKS